MIGRLVCFTENHNNSHFISIMWPYVILLQGILIISLLLFSVVTFLQISVTLATLKFTPQQSLSGLPLLYYDLHIAISPTDFTEAAFRSAEEICDAAAKPRDNECLFLKPNTLCFWHNLAPFPVNIPQERFTVSVMWNIPTAAATPHSPAPRPLVILNKSGGSNAVRKVWIKWTMTVFSIAVEMSLRKTWIPNDTYYKCLQNKKCSSLGICL